VNYVPFSPPVEATASLSGSLVTTSGVGLAGYTVILTNSSGVSFTQTTDANGLFSFTNLAPGTYTLTYLPEPLVAISATPGGTAGNPSDGTVVNAQEISQIVVNSGDNASNYQFEAMLLTA
jgi:serine-aspartate repeat-containing protein C/D/E